MGILRHNRLASNGVRGNLRFGILIRQYCYIREKPPFELIFSELCINFSVDNLVGYCFLLIRSTIKDR